MTVTSQPAQSDAEISTDNQESMQQIEEAEDLLFDEILVDYHQLLHGYKQTLSRTIVVKQTSNFSGVAGPIYSSSTYETSVALQNTTNSSDSDDSGY